MTNLRCGADGDGCRAARSQTDEDVQIHYCNALLEAFHSCAARVVDRRCSRTERVPIPGSVECAATQRSSSLGSCAQYRRGMNAPPTISTRTTAPCSSLQTSLCPRRCNLVAAGAPQHTKVCEISAAVLRNLPQYSAAMDIAMTYE